jgi:transcriptional regulator
MHKPRHFEEPRLEVLHGILRDHSFATLVTALPDGPLIDHIPMVLDAARGAHGTLRGHVARANPLVRALSEQDGAPATAIFMAAQHYISPSWYPGKRTDPRVVPTWNYVVVHAEGTLRLVDDAKWVLNMVNDLTDQHEAGRPGRWRMSDAPADYLDKMARAIVGVELVITQLAGKVKASQNRSAEDRAGVVRGLVMEDREAASAMSRWIPLDGGPVI